MSQLRRKTEDDRPRILLLRALGLGDFLTGIPAYRSVRRAFPDHETVLAAPSHFSALAQLTGAIDTMLPAGELEPLAWPHPAPALAIDLHGKGIASHRLLTALRPRRLIAFDEPAADPPSVPWIAGEHEVHRWCRLLNASGIPADPDDLDLDLETPQLPPAKADRDGPAPVLIHPGAAAPSRRWPAERFAEVAAHLHRDGHPVLITGSDADRPRARHVASRARLGDHAVLAGDTDLLALTALVARSALVVCGDTGIAHLATACRRPSVVLFGPVPPSEWGPPANRPWHAVLHNAPAAYRGDPHGNVTDPALTTITTDQVLDACATILRTTDAHSPAPH